MLDDHFPKKILFLIKNMSVPNAPFFNQIFFCFLWKLINSFSKYIPKTFRILAKHFDKVVYQNWWAWHAP